MMEMPGSIQEQATARICKKVKRTVEGKWSSAECVSFVETQVEVCKEELRERLPWLINSDEVRYLLFELNWCRAIAYSGADPKEFARKRRQRYQEWQKDPVAWEPPGRSH